MQRIVMDRIVEGFKPGCSYVEREVNQIILEFLEEVATTRHSLMSFKLMEKEEGNYKKVTIEPRIEIRCDFANDPQLNPRLG